MGTLRDKNGTKNAKNSAFKYFCETCDYGTSKKSNYDTHILSDKHSMVTNGYKKGQLSAEIQPKSYYFENENFICNCGKQYKHRQGLWRHKKTCSFNPEKITDNKKLSELDKDELIITLLKQNAELIKGQQDMMKGQQDMMIKLTENGITNHSHNTTTNSHNKAFNLNFFLNETCKNAMNINDFVDSIKLQLTDLMEVGELGYVEGISKIIVKNLNNLDETVRPVHCTDKKRETMYVKDEGQWEKEDDNKSKLKRAINRVANKNIRLLPQFRENYPEYKNSSSKISDVHDKLVIEVMQTDDDKKEKIIKNISKATCIKKNE